MSIDHLVIPDPQAKQGRTTEHLTWAGQYAVDKKPAVIIAIGDWWDMPSLSVYDIGKKGFEGRTYRADIDAGNEAMDAFMRPIVEYNEKQRRQKGKQYKPRLVFTIGNHEQRIERAIESDRKLEGLISYDDFNLKKYGWEVHDFLVAVKVDGVMYSHYFTSGQMGRPVSSARIMLNKKHMSCVMGHVQDRDIDFQRRADNTKITGIFVGIFYPDEEQYLTPQTNGSWVGIWLLEDVRDGEFHEVPVPIEVLKDKYGSAV